MTSPNPSSDAATERTGSPRWHVPLSDIAVDDELLAAAHEVLRSGWWSMGPTVGEFERAFAHFCGVEHALGVSSGTAALQLALVALGCGPGDEVVLPSLNFVAAANAVAHTGATPVFCDIAGDEDLNLDPSDLERAIGPRTRAVIVLHYGGFPCAVDAVLELAERTGIAVIEDAAHAPGASWRGKQLGTLGRVGCFSFFSNKNLPVGEGGMVVTGDDVLAERLRLLRSHGMTTLTWDRHQGHASSYDVVRAGFNYRLDEVRAAIGLVQLRRLESANRRRAEIVSRYRSSLESIDGLQMPFSGGREGEISAHHLAVVLLPAGISRTRVRAGLADRGIQTSVHYPPIHTFSAYAGAGQRPLPRTEAVAERILTLPLFPHMTVEQTDAVVSSLRTAVQAAGLPEARRSS